MGRDMPVDCDRCGGVMDWGDFGPAEDGSVGTTCTCDPEPLELGQAVELLIAAAKARGYKGMTVSFDVGDESVTPVSAPIPVVLDVSQVEPGRPSRVVEGEDY